MLSVWLIRKSKKGKKMSKWMNLERIDDGKCGLLLRGQLPLERD